MRKIGWGLTVIAASFFVAVKISHWDSRANPGERPKYELEQVGKKDLGIITYTPMPAGKKLREFTCIGSTKECGPGAEDKPEEEDRKSVV